MDFKDPRPQSVQGGAQQLGLQNYRHMYRVPAKDPVGGDSVFLFLNKDDVIVFLDM